MTEQLDHITIKSKKDPTHSIIWLHGLGADGHDFAGILPELKLHQETTRVIFPHAPIRPITINNGYPMRGWYDILSMDFSEKNEDLAGIEESSAQILMLMAKEKSLGIPSQNILLAGFSQGGVLALHIGLRHECAGILALSTYLSDPENCPSCTSEKPILQMHGTEDNIVPYQSGRESFTTLQKHGFIPLWKEYPMQHQVCAAQIQDIAHWLQQLGF